MTKEEAKEIITQHHWSFASMDDEVIEAVECLIKDAEPCEELEFIQPHKKVSVNLEVCTDAISRQAVLTYIEHILTHGMGKKKSFEFIKKYVERQPSITPNQKMGRWLAVENEDMHTVDYFCSECDLPLETEERTPFCPNCGKKMEVEESG